MKKIVSILIILIMLLAYIPALAADADELGRVTELSAKNTGYEEVTFTWKAVPGAYAYDVYKKESYGWKWLKATKATSYVDADVTNGETCTYTARAYFWKGDTKITGVWNGIGASCKSEFAAASGFTAKNTGIREITVSWKSVKGAYAYDVYRKKVNEKGWTWQKATTSTTFIDKNAEVEETYIYTARPYFWKGDTKITGVWNGTGVSCKSQFAAASGFTAKNTGICEITVNWQPVKGTYAYDVYRKKADEKGWTWQKATTSTTFIDKNAEVGETYIYTARPYVWMDGTKVIGKRDENGATCYSDFPAVTGITAENTGIRVITVNWQPVKG
ncbi:MAG: hypothetical protein IJO77_05565, partial [Oscillospiraceae bacterium]|nr:hypothetical protein [Oscillospiraceae bacterium]